MNLCFHIYCVTLCVVASYLYTFTFYQPFLMIMCNMILFYIISLNNSAFSASFALHYSIILKKKTKLEMFELSLGDLITP